MLNLQFLRYYTAKWCILRKNDGKICLYEISMHLQSAEYQKVKGDLQIKHVFAGLICIYMK